MLPGRPSNIAIRVFMERRQYDSGRRSITPRRLGANLRFERILRLFIRGSYSITIFFSSFILLQYIIQPAILSASE